MKKIFALLLFFAVVGTVHAQKKNQSEVVTEVQTATPVFFVILEGDEGDGAQEVQLHDRKHQIQSMEYDRVTDQAKGLEPKNPLTKWIAIPEIGALAFRMTETLEESKLPVDGITVLAMKLNKVKEAHRIIYILPQ